MAGISLYDHQRKALAKMHNGCILCGGVGSGKSRTGLAYYFQQQGGNLDEADSIMKKPRDLYIITTAKKRDKCEWGEEMAPFLLSVHPEANYYKNTVVVDSWNNIGKYKDVKDAQSTDRDGLAASRNHRGFGGFSMGSMNTWRTFEHALNYFRYFAPSSGGPIGDGAYMADIVKNSGHSPEDFFLFTASGTEDFAYSSFKNGVLAMGATDVFAFADNERDGNLSFREREGYAHDGTAANEYMYNALRFFWN